MAVSSQTANDLMSVFSNTVTAGFASLAGPVNGIFGLMIGLVVALTGIQWAVSANRDALAGAFSKILLIGAFAYIINDWQGLSETIFAGFMQIGLQAGGGAIGAGDFLNPGAVIETGWGIVKAIGDAPTVTENPMDVIGNLVDAIIIGISMLGIMIAFTILALQIIVTLLEFKIVTQQIKKSSVRAVFMVTAGVLSLAFIYAFVVSPAVRAEARAKRAEENQRTPPGSVRPADVLSDGPVSYADLTKAPPVEDGPPAVEQVKPAPVSAGPAHAPRVIVERATREPRYPVAHAPKVVQQVAPTVEPRSLSELERARRSGLFFKTDTAAQTASIAAAPASPTGVEKLQRTEDYDAVYSKNAVLEPLSRYELKAGTVIPAALLTTVDTEREGRVLGIVTENVFDTVTGSYLLVPQGTRLIGRFDGDQTYGERRAFLMWERLIFPDGRSIMLNREPGVDSEGAGGVQGRVDRRIPELVTATLFAGAITTLGEVARRDGDDKDSSILGDIGDAAASEAARVGGRMIDRELEVKPTIRVRQGTRVQVLLTHDLILEPQL
jgi:type IV secretion system protein TrbI